MPVNVEVVTPAQYAQWIASKGGKMPGAKPAAAPVADAAAATPQPAEAGTATPIATNQAATAQN